MTVNMPFRQEYDTNFTVLRPSSVRNNQVKEYSSLVRLPRTDHFYFEISDRMITNKKQFNCFDFNRKKRTLTNAFYQKNV